MIKRLIHGFNYLRKGQFYSFRRAVLWPEGDYKRAMLKRIQRIYQCPYFIETGTYKGQTPKALHTYFKQIWTIEIEKKLYEEAKNALKGYPNVTCIWGDSKNILPDIVSNLDNSCIFWLDGHYSGGETGRGETDSPIIEELEAIKSGAIKNHIIVIDDVSDFSKAEGNAPLSQVIAMIESINPRYKFYFDYDMLFALPYEQAHREFWRKIVFPVVIR